jgi:hypothetical protein
MAGQATAKRLEAVSTENKDKQPVETPKDGGKLEAATSEVVDSSGVRMVSWRDLELIVPQEVPPVLMFDFISMENEQGAFSLMRMFMTLLDGEQFIQVRNVIGKLKPEEQVEAITDLSDAIMSSYGTTPGESEASEDS